ncbi:MAG: Gfo/Idh/MocA family oxidoreductase [Kiritimatiellia bacterium]|nr:Gfo/Idh/MocA family oxidoreductase [Kiritimatiellia bacterium]
MSKSKLRIGIIGTGSRGIHCFGRLLSHRDDACVVALCDPNPVRLDLSSRTFSPAPACYTSIREMAGREKLDAVVITSPDYCHESNAVEALKCGLHVLIDKPLSTTVKGCRAICRAARDAGKTVMIGFNLRQEPTLKRLKALIDEGALGKVFLIENREFYGGGRTYMARWNRSYALSGGLWVHKGSHDFDVFNWLLGFPKPRKVTAMAGINVLHPGGIPFPVEAEKPVGPTCTACAYRATCPDVYPEIADMEAWGAAAQKADGYAKDLCIYTSDKDTHDNGVAIVEYENGARASHLECFVTSASDRRYTVVGDLGQAEVSLHDRTITLRKRWSQELTTLQIAPVAGSHGGADPGLVDSFLRVIRGETPNPSTLENGLYSTAIGQAAEIARREDRVVFIEELLSATDA